MSDCVIHKWLHIFLDQVHTTAHHEIGSVVWIVVATLVLFVGWIAIPVYALVKKHKTLESLKESELKYKSTMESALVGIYVIQDLKFTYVNPAMVKYFGYDSAEDLISVSPIEITAPEDREKVKRRLTERAVGIVSDPYTVRCIRKDGSRFIATVWGKGVSVNNRPASVGTLVDITSQIEDQKSIERLAYYDQLTELPNRAYFAIRADEALERAQSKTTHTNFGLFLIDIDDFKRINDTRGHAYGDLVLQEVASRIHPKIRACANQCHLHRECRCFAARLGGDEFVILLEGIVDTQHADHAANEILQSFYDPVLIEGHKLNISVSIGIALYPQSGSSVSTLLKSADLALYAAKERGKNQYYFHDKSLSNKIDTLVQYERHIRYFVETEDFDVHFQAIYDVELDKIVGAETLFRSNVDKFGPLDLQTVIDVAEQTGLIVPLGAAIFKRACIECKKCDVLGPDRINSVNVSTRQLEDPEFVNMCCKTMDLIGVAPHNMAIEVTESMLMNNPDEGHAKLLELRELGMQVFIDDFGKGFSSMTYLRHLPADKLKIDKAFIDDITDDRAAVDMLQGINDLAHNLGLKTCAEGVETKEQLEILRMLEIDQVQGYLIGKPVPAEEFTCPKKEGEKLWLK